MPSPYSIIGNGCLTRMVKVLSSVARHSSTTEASTCPKESRAAQRFRLATQSAARTGVPSWNESPSRSVIVQVRPSPDTLWPAAICGRATKFASSP